MPREGSKKSSNQIIPLPPPMPDDPKLVALTEKAHRETTDYLEEEAKRSPPEPFLPCSPVPMPARTAIKPPLVSGRTVGMPMRSRLSSGPGTTLNAACLMCHVTGFADQGEDSSTYYARLN